MLLPTLNLAAVLCEGALSFFHLPDLALVPREQVPTVKGVSLLVTDERARTEPSDYPSVSLTLVRRKTIALVRLARNNQGTLDWILESDVTSPVAPLAAGRWGKYVLFATLEEYQLLDLSTSSVVKLGLPISQVGAAPSAATRPAILAVPRYSFRSNRIKRATFLVTSHAPDGSLGVFVDPTTRDIQPMLIEWPAHPRSLTLALLPQPGGKTNGRIVALLRNDQLQVHAVDVGYGLSSPLGEAEAQRGSYPPQMVADLPLPPACADARFLSSGKYEFGSDSHSATGAAVELEAWDLPAQISRGEMVDSDDLVDDEIWASRLSTCIVSPSIIAPAPPESEEEPESEPPADSDSGSKSSILLGTADALFVVSRPSLASRARPLLRSGRINELSSLLDSLPLSTWDRTVSTNTFARTLAHIVGWVHFRALRFAPAFTFLQRGGAPLAWILQLFPELLDGLPPLESHHDQRVPACVAKCYALWSPTPITLAELIRINLLLNYDPKLPIPSTAILQQRLDPSHPRNHRKPNSVEALFDALYSSARSYLSSWIESASQSHHQATGILPTSSDTDRTLTTILAHLYTLAPARDTQATNALHALIRCRLPNGLSVSPPQFELVDWNRIVPVLRATGRWHTLARLAHAQLHIPDFLRLATELADGSTIDLALRIAWAELELQQADGKARHEAYKAAQDRSDTGTGLERVSDSSHPIVVFSPQFPLALEPLTSGDVLACLTEVASPDLATQYVQWVVKFADPGAGVEALARARVQEGEAKDHHLKMIELMRAVDDQAEQQEDGKGAKLARMYLERVALDLDATLGVRQLLLQDLLDHLSSRLASSSSSPESLTDDKLKEEEQDEGEKDDTTVRRLQELQRVYAQGMYSESFFAHLAVHIEAGPNEQILAGTIRTRIKLILLLQAYTLLLIPPCGAAHPEAADQCEYLLDRLSSTRGSTAGVSPLVFERSILLGPLGQHEEALRLLGVELGDTNSAETYCLLLGVVISPMVATRLVDSNLGHLIPPPGSTIDSNLEMRNLVAYTTLLNHAATNVPASGSVNRPTTTTEVDGTESDRRDLFMRLLKVYTTASDRYVLRPTLPCPSDLLSSKYQHSSPEELTTFICLHIDPAKGSRFHSNICSPLRVYDWLRLRSWPNWTIRYRSTVYVPFWFEPPDDNRTNATLPNCSRTLQQPMR